MAAKKTSDLIPLCHPIAISRVKVELDVVSEDAEDTIKGEDVEIDRVSEGTENANKGKGRENKSSRGQTSMPWAGTGQGDAYAWHEKHHLDLALNPKARVHPKATQPGTERVDLPVEDTLARCGRIDITATVECDGKTGVEMEALSAASMAALTVYDMCKAVDKGMVIEGLRVVRKEGGKSGTWVLGESIVHGHETK